MQVEARGWPRKGGKAQLLSVLHAAMHAIRRSDGIGASAHWHFSAPGATTLQRATGYERGSSAHNLLQANNRDSVPGLFGRFEFVSLIL